MEKKEIAPLELTFYKLEKSENPDWRDTLSKETVFDRITTFLISNFHFRNYIFSDEWAISLQNALGDPALKDEVAVLSKLNNYVYESVFGKDPEGRGKELKSIIEEIFGSINCNSFHHLSIVFSFLSEALGQFNLDEVDKKRESNSLQFRRLLNSSESEVLKLKNEFFVEEITRCFSLEAPPPELKTVLLALSFLKTETEIEWPPKEFSTKEICDFLMRVKPWHINRFMRNRLQNLFLYTDKWSLEKVSKQSRDGYVMGIWLEELVQASALIENIRSPSKKFVIPMVIDYTYLEFPGNKSIGFGVMNRSLYPSEDMHADYFIGRLEDYFKKLKKQGMRKDYLHPDYLIIYDGRQAN